MPRQNRAKIFAPYDALKGFEETVHAKDDIFVRRAELAEYAQERLDRKLRRLHRGDTVTVTWFRPKPGADSADIGQYMTVTGVVERIDPVSRALFLGRRRIPMEDISELRGAHPDGSSERKTTVEVSAPEAMSHYDARLT